MVLLPINASAQIRLVDVTEAAGLRGPLAGIMGHGGAWGDYDGDGLIDLYVGGFSDRPNEEYRPAPGPVANKLLRNLGDGKFAEVPGTPLSFYARTSGAVFADLDNDGTPELYVANNCKGKSSAAPGPQRDAQLRHASLFRYAGGKWIDISASSGACPDSMGTARNIGVFDYDGDGLLDLFVVEDRFIRNPRSVLLKNLGDLKFRDVNKEVGLPDDVFGLGLAVGDVNEDGLPDFFVAHSNRLFLSQGGGRYRECVELADVFAWKRLDGEDWPCGAAFGDLNRDGRLDLVLSIHFERARNRIFLNGGVKDGIPQFRDVTHAVGLPEEMPEKCPHVEIQDFDNDGWLDIYMSMAWLDDAGHVTPLVYRNRGVADGLPQFELALQGHGKPVYYPAGPSGDYDNDGRVDLFLINWYQGNHSRLLKNESPPQHWLDVKVVGRTANRMGIGSQVRVYRAGMLDKPAGLVGFGEITTGYGYASGQQALCHFGLGDQSSVDLTITLPGGKVIHKGKVAADQRLVVEEP